MDIESFVERLKASIKKEIEANHAGMDQGKSHDEYMKLVGRNAALTKLRDLTIKELTVDLQREDEDD